MYDNDIKLTKIHASVAISHSLVHLLYSYLLHEVLFSQKRSHSTTTTTQAKI